MVGGRVENSWKLTVKRGDTNRRADRKIVSVGRIFIALSGGRRVPAGDGRTRNRVPAIDDDSRAGWRTTGREGVYARICPQPGGRFLNYSTRPSDTMAVGLLEQTVRARYCARLGRGGQTFTATVERVGGERESDGMGECEIFESNTMKGRRINASGFCRNQSNF